MPQTLQKFKIRRRCVNGETLWLAIDYAVETHDPDAIREAVEFYFLHVNGNDRGARTVPQMLF